MAYVVEEGGENNGSGAGVESVVCMNWGWGRRGMISPRREKVGGESGLRR
jgi:hypothetical protein